MGNYWSATLVVPVADNDRHGPWNIDIITVYFRDKKYSRNAVQQRFEMAKVIIRYMGFMAQVKRAPMRMDTEYPWALTELGGLGQRGSPA